MSVFIYSSRHRFNFARVKDLRIEGSKNRNKLFEKKKGKRGREKSQTSLCGWVSANRMAMSGPHNQTEEVEDKKERTVRNGDEARLHRPTVLTHWTRCPAAWAERPVRFFFATGLAASSFSLPSWGFPFLSTGNERGVRYAEDCSIHW